MSRELKPVELFLADNTMVEVFHRPTMRRYNSKLFSELYFLLTDFDSIYDKCQNSDTALVILEDIEKYIEGCEAYALDNPKDKGKDLQLTKDLNKFFDYPIDTVVREWFEGRLTTNNNQAENDALFRTYILQFIEKRL